MNYAIQTLYNEFRTLSKLIRESNWDNHPEALKDRLKKLKELKQALRILDLEEGKTNKY